MASQQTNTNQAGQTPTTPRRARAKTRTTGRSGAATGMANTIPQGLTAEQRKFYNLGAKHACEMHGVPFSGGISGGR